MMVWDCVNSPMSEKPAGFKILSSISSLSLHNGRKYFAPLAPYFCHFVSYYYLYFSSLNHFGEAFLKYILDVIVHIFDDFSVRYAASSS